MLVVKCKECGNIFDYVLEHRKEGNEVKVFTTCPKCNAEKLSHYEVGGNNRPSNNKENKKRIHSCK